MASGRKMTLEETRPKANKNRAEELQQRPRRTRVGGRRDILTLVEGRDPNFEYRFVKDVVKEGDRDGSLVVTPGQRIQRFLDDGWTFVTKDEVIIGDNYVYKTENLGSIVKVPAGQDEYLYLMKINKEWFEEDKMELEKQRYNIDELQTSAAMEQGLYGSVSFEK